MLIAQISDCHIRSGPSPFDKLVDSSETLKQVVSHLLSNKAQPDVLLATGDLTESGTDEEYVELLDLLSPLDLPRLPIPGNHDEYSKFENSLERYLPKELPNSHCSYVNDDFPIRLIGLDTSLPGRHDGDFDDERFEWLEEKLVSDSEKPTLLFTHFPPFASGIHFMDISGLKNSERLCSLIEKNPQIKLVVSGHLHRPIATMIGSSVASVCPSTSHQLGLELNPEYGSLVDEPPGYQLHRCDGHRFTTHTATVWEVKTFDLSSWISEVNQQSSRGTGFPKK